MGKIGKIEEEKLNSKLKLFFFHFHQIGPCTRSFLIDTCTRQQSMQGDRSTAVTEHLDGETILMDV